MSVFIPKEPVLKNQFLDDEVLLEYLERIIPQEFKAEIFKDLERFGEKVISEILELGVRAEQNQPILKTENNENFIEICDAWKALHNISAIEGLISIGHKAKYREFARVYQFSKKYLFNSSSAYFSCPLAMTDGALKLLIEVNGNDSLELNNAINALLSDSPSSFWTSGQWMTEQKGGSDVSQTETIAKFNGKHWCLYGLKWFTSAVDSEMALTLARPEGEKGLQLFFVKTRDEHGNLNNIKIKGLKNKLGTKALPTAELELCGTIAIPIGKEGEGVKLISTQFNVTRIHNALECVSSMRRQLALLEDYANYRNSFGKKLIEHELFKEVLSELKLTHKRCFLFTMKVVELLGLSEKSKDLEKSSDAINKLRLLTPLLKMYTAKENIKLSSEVLESFGGVGYIEDSGIPKFYRDAQVLSIWEGTTNVLCLDFLRAIEKISVEPLKELMFSQDFELIKENISKYKNQNDLEKNARKICFRLSNAICDFLIRN